MTPRQQTLIGLITHYLQFSSSLEGEVDRIYQRIVTAGVVDSSLAEYAEALSAALASPLASPSPMPQPYSTADFRRFLQRLLDMARHDLASA